MNFHKKTCMLLWTILAGVLLTSLSAGAQTCTTSKDGQPCFTDVGDYFHGERSILPVDDLAWVLHRASGDSDGLVRVPTTNLTIPFQPSGQILNPAVTCQLLRGPERARLFNTTRDWVAMIRGNSNESLCGKSADLMWEDPQNTSTLTKLTISEDVPNSLEVTAFDVNQDGYADLVVYDSKTIRIFTAVDVNDPSKGLKLVATTATIYGLAGKPAIGDFNGDGAIDIIVPVRFQVSIPDYPTNKVMYYYNMYGYSVCPVSGYVMFSKSTDRDVPPYTCPADWTIRYRFGTGQIELRAFGPSETCPVWSGVTCPSSYDYWSAYPPRLVAGDFLGLQNGRSEMIADLEQIKAGSPSPYFRTHQFWKFDDALNATLVSTLGPTADGVVKAERHDFIHAAKMHATGVGSGRDQAIVYADSDTTANLNLITVDNAGKMTSYNQQISNYPPSSGGQRIGNVVGMAVGRFDPANGGTVINLDRQVALLYNDVNYLGPFTPRVWSIAIKSYDQSWKVADVGGNWQFVNTQDYAGYAGFDYLEGMLRSVDMQGRSVEVGEPLKLTLEDHLQPTLALGIPPMHIDYIKNYNLQGPEVINFTVRPSGYTPSPSFNSQYTFESSSKNEHVDSTTTDVSNSYGGTVDAKLYLGDTDEKKANFSVQSKTAITQAYQDSNETKNTNYDKFTKVVDSTTGFADRIFYRSSRLNIYYYPIIGKTCPTDIPSCSDGQKLQTYYQVSAPDSIDDFEVDATTQEWYQPAQEPGNVFSYPWSLKEMQALDPTLTQISGPATWNQPDTSSHSYKTQWASGGSTAVTTGSVDKFDVKEDVTVTGRKTFGIPKIAGGGVEVAIGFNFARSTSTKTQNIDTASLDATSGIQVNVPNFSTDVATRYFYYFTSYILGTNGSAFPSLTSPTVLAPDKQPVQQQFFGPIVVAYAADPFHSASTSSWWSAAYSKPDIGLNHPSRWSWDSDTRTASFNYREVPSLNSTAVLNDLFYHMKGLFIGQASDDPSASPNLSVADEGDVLRLQARVYNFSVANMPQGSTVRARFYGQQRTSARGELTGDAFLIGDSKIGPIPGFNSTTDKNTLPNWAMASTTFDTTPYAGKYLVFWVVVWAEDGAGNLLNEQEGHGLTQNPSSMTFKQITDVPVEDYSNNVGMYGTYTPFFVVPKRAATSSQADETDHGDVADLAANDVIVEATPATRKTDRCVVTATIHNTTSGHLSSEPIVFYDGDPNTGAQPFDVQRISWLAKDDTYAVRTFLPPGAKGYHSIFVRVGWKEHAAPSMASTTLRVP